VCRPEMAWYTSNLRAVVARMIRAVLAKNIPSFTLNVVPRDKRESELDTLRPGRVHARIHCQVERAALNWRYPKLHPTRKAGLGVKYGTLMKGRTHFIWQSYTVISPTSVIVSNRGGVTSCWIRRTGFDNRVLNELRTTCLQKEQSEASYRWLPGLWVHGGVLNNTISGA
jgi:hypothetical protein